MRIHSVFRWLTQLASHVVPVVVANTKGQLGGLLQVQLWKGKPLLDGARVNYSYGALQRVMERALAHPWVLQMPAKGRMLLLGMGAGGAALLMRKLQPTLPIDAVEADAKVIELAKRWFGLGNIAALQVHHAFAQDFLATGPSNTYSLIVVDVFVEDEIPQEMLETDTLAKLHALLLPGGVLVFNTLVPPYPAPPPGFAQELHGMFTCVDALQLEVNRVWICVK